MCPFFFAFLGIDQLLLFFSDDRNAFPNNLLGGGGAADM
jgi:hypothetical protein